MLKIREDFNIKELEKYKIYPEYVCNTRTGETRVRAFTTECLKFEKLRFEKIYKKITSIFWKNTSSEEYILRLNTEIGEMIDLDTLYDLIKADIVIKE